MSHGVRLHRAAERELDEAAASYDSEGPGLGSAFLDEVIVVLAFAHDRRQPFYWRGRE